MIRAMRNVLSRPRPAGRVRAAEGEVVRKIPVSQGFPPAAAGGGGVMLRAGPLNFF